MKYIFELNHPKHYYQFRSIMSILQEHGHEIKVLARDKDVLLNVLKEEKIPYVVFGVHKNNILGKVLSSISILFQYIKIAKRFRPDLIVSKASLYGTVVAKVMKCKSCIFPDSEVVTLTNKVVAPLATYIITPESFAIDFGKKHIRVKGVFEDCYLSPEVLSINDHFPEEHGLKRPYAILRFVGWSANHDLHNNGFSLEEKNELVNTISKFMTVYISSEKELPAKLAGFKLSTPSAQIHHVLANASLYVGDSQTMATEAALLGTPAIRSNSFVGEKDMSIFKLLESKYGLLLNIRDFKTVLETVKAFAEFPKKEEWIKKRDVYYASVGSTSLYITQLLEHWPETL